MPQSPELAGGAGFTFEGMVAARYLVALLCESGAPGIENEIVTQVSVQQRAFGEPLDDLIVDFWRKDGRRGRLSLQAKRSLTISAAASNADFREIIRDSLKTLQKTDFRQGIDRFGAATGSVATGKFDDLTGLCELARASDTDFESRFAAGGIASDEQRALRDVIVTLLSEELESPCPPELLHRFLKHFVIIRFDYLHEGAVDSAKAIDAVRPALADADNGQAPALWAALCRIAREGAGRAQQFSRPALVNSVSKVVCLRGAPSLRDDLAKIRELAKAWVQDIDDDVRGTRLTRPKLVKRLDALLTRDRFVQVRGLPGSGKSVLLRRRVDAELLKGPVLFLKSDRLEGKSWASFATQLGLSGADLVALLVEIEAVGSNTLYIDGIDRIEKQHQGVVADVVRAILREPMLANWHVVISLRDAGSEPLRTWLPDLFATGRLGTVDVDKLDDNEARELAEGRPELKRLLFGARAVQEIVRRPFFAKILSQGLSSDSGFTPKSEVDLIENWWRRGGFNASGTTATKRQRAIVDLGRIKARELSRPIALNELSHTTLEVVDELVSDGILQVVQDGHTIRFAHDIFFEWAFFHRLVDCRTEWPDEIKRVGEPPIIGRVVELLSQSDFEADRTWGETLAGVEKSNMRSQWTRAWLLGPLSAPSFEENAGRYYHICARDEFRLLKKTLVWFQAEKTVPNAAILAGKLGSADLTRDEIVRFADLLGWPSDFGAWRRLIVLVLDHLDTVPLSLAPDAVVLFEVWQNAVGDISNPVSTRLLTQCAAWLSDIEQRQHSRQRREEKTRSPWYELRSDLQELEQSLRRLLLRSARVEPALVTAYLEELRADHDRLDRVFTDLVSYSPILAPTQAQLLADLTLLHLKEDLPQARLEQEQEEWRAAAERRAAARAKPAAERSRLEELEVGPFSILGSSFNSFDWDSLAVDRDLGGYFPPSPLREPFHSLFEVAPAEALRVLKDLTNHAMTAWRQLHTIDPQRRGTPIPIVLEFPWGEQSFWGTRREYLWSRGLWAPKPLAAAYLALENWTFKQLESGRAADEIIEEIVRGNEGVAVLGTAVSLTLQSLTTSRTTLPLATEQRLWRADLERYVQEASTASASLIGFMKRSDRPHALAVDAINKRPVRRLWLREFVGSFVLSSDQALAQTARERIAEFEVTLPFEYVEQRANDDLTQDLARDARINAEFAKPENYKTVANPENADQAVTYLDNPEAKKPEVQESLARSTERLSEQHLWFWANKSLDETEMSGGVNVPAALAFARRIDSDRLFELSTEDQTLIGMRRGAVAGTAAVVLKYRAQFDAEDIAWARRVIERAATTPEERDGLWSSGALIPWHPCHAAAKAIGFEIRAGDLRPCMRHQLLRLVAHPLDEASLGAVQVALSLWDIEPRLGWCALWEGLALCQFEVRPMEAGSRYYNPVHIARERAQIANKAIEHFDRAADWPDLPAMPPAWVAADEGSEADIEDDDPRVRRHRWREPTTVWDWNYGEKIVELIPSKALLNQDSTRTRFLAFATDLLGWVIKKIAPPWKKPGRHERTQHFHELDDAMGKLFARLATDLDTTEIRRIFLDPLFALEDELCFDLLAPFVSRYVQDNVAHAEQIESSTVEILGLCLERILQDPIFDPTSYRAGELHGWELPSIIRSLLFDSVEDVSLAAQFAQRHGSEVASIMPIIDRLVRAAGWAAAVMADFLTLCERARETYPAEVFADQILSVLGRPLKAWRGTLLSARIAGLVQHLAFRDTPMNVELAQKLLRILDEMVDMGDRRSAALQISDSFREVRAA